MPETLDLKNIVEDILYSYETRIESITSIFDTTQSILIDFQESLFNTKEERGKTSTQLREILAKNENLRKKDFDNMMEGILLNQGEREKEVRALLKEYLDEQKIMAQALRENLAKFKDFLARGEAERVKEFQALIKDILAEQEKRKEDAIFKLEEFQKQQNDLATRLRELLARGDNLRIRDFKLMLQEFKAQREKRLALQKERKKEVVKMLDRFKKERQRDSSPRAVHPVRKLQHNIEQTSSCAINSNNSCQREDNHLSNGVNIDQMKPELTER